MVSLFATLTVCCLAPLFYNHLYPDQSTILPGLLRTSRRQFWPPIKQLVFGPGDSALTREQLGDILLTMVHYLRSGFPLGIALEFTVKELGGSVAASWVPMLAAHRAGAPWMHASAQLPAATRRLAAVRQLLLLLAVSEQSGGDVTPALLRLHKGLLNDEIWHAKLRSAISEARLTSKILAVLPWVVIAIYGVMSPSSLVELLAAPSGRSALVVSLTLWLLGLVIQKRLITKAGVR